MRARQGDSAGITAAVLAGASRPVLDSATVSAGAALLRLAGPVPRCPACQAVLCGGPVVLYCGPCGRGVMAADVDVEFHPPASESAAGVAR